MRGVVMWKMIVASLGLVVIVLAAVLGWVLVTRREKVATKVVVLPTQLAPSTPATPPVYPRKDPEYPLNGVRQEFQQVGVLVGKKDEGTEPVVLPLFGRKMESHRDRWEYYVATDQFHMWKLPIQQKNRMCDDDIGCEEIYQGDDIVVPDYDNIRFTARIYKYAKQ